MVRKEERKLTAAEEKRYAEQREQAQNDFPPKVPQASNVAADSIPARLRGARE